ncbi:MAG: hypothetical protein GY765_35175, partial [bacterium]|nr:hypothetical protein [bacterium]
MKVLEITHIEDCFDGSFIKELHLDEPVTEAFIYHLEPMGNLQYFPH